MNSNLTAEVVAPSQAAVERAAMNATAGLARNMVAPKTSYEFEATWKGFANDRQSQSRLLKVNIVVPCGIYCDEDANFHWSLTLILLIALKLGRSWSHLHCQKCSRIYWGHHC